MLRQFTQRLLQIDGILDERPFTSPTQVLEAMCGAQAQELSSGLLSLRPRSQGLTARNIEAERAEHHTILWTWVMRGTLHLISADDARWMIPFFAPGLIAAGQRRLKQLGWDEPRLRSGLRLLSEALEQQEVLSRGEIVRLLAQNNLPDQGQAPLHLLYRAALEGLVCLGPVQSGKATYILLERRVGSLNPLPADEALAKLARRYLAAFGPASVHDLASWSGLKVSRARQAIDTIESEVIAVNIAGSPGWLLKEHLLRLEALPDVENSRSKPVVRLLPRYDTYLLGYASRELIVDQAQARRVNPGGGIIHAVVLVDGQAKGLWKIRQGKQRLKVQIEPFEILAEEVLQQLEAEIEDIGRFLERGAVLDLNG